LKAESIGIALSLGKDFSNIKVNNFKDLFFEGWEITISLISLVVLQFYQLPLSYNS
jgi:hypothetical protein